jgi:hypothetical protein
MTPCHDGRKRSAPRPQCADFGTRFARKRRSPHGEAVKVQTAKAASGRRSTRRRLRPGREQIKSEGRQEGEYKCGRTWVNGHANEAGRGARRQQRNIALPAHCRARECGMVTGSAAGGRRSASTGWTRVGAHGTDAGRAGPQGTIYSTPRRPSGWTWWPAPRQAASDSCFARPARTRRAGPEPAVPAVVWPRRGRARQAARRP